ncbi:hypothetical protein FWK35_00029189 [Aphis craccivora]|uniref:Uncharacterized protein n=1 Tax=Aphis craccivora TaxID=307492 RepID=A0A6G0Y5Q9_APHCR|nr:hypothetical protein FWK35_00029189 [Aphis craccivora]
MMCFFFVCAQHITLSKKRFNFKLRVWLPIVNEYPWCITEIKSKNFPTVFKKIEKI